MPGCANENCARCYVEKTDGLKLCREVCNGIKHLNRTGMLPGRGVNYVDASAWVFLRWRTEGESGCLKDSYQDVFPAVLEARNAWLQFLIDAGEVESRESYEARYGIGADGIGPFV